ncbi:MAG: DUF4271 domain-containing protein [Crocinitomicaceae bacterium]
MNPTDFDIGVLTELTSSPHPIFWVLVLLGTGSIILARIIKSSYINGLFQYTKNYNQQLFSLNSLSTPFLIFNYLIALSLSIYLFIDSKEQNLAEETVIYVFITILTYYILKIGIQYFLANWFQRKELFAVKNAFRSYQIVGLIILPICTLSIYQTSGTKLYISYFIFSIVILSLLFVWYFSLKDSIQYKISLFYIFLYLCTLEILPLLLIAEYVLN